MPQAEKLRTQRFMDQEIQSQNGSVNEQSSPAQCSAATWRVTADDDPEKEWDSDNCDDAFMDADMAFMDGARKVTIQIIMPPNDELKHGAKNQ